METIFKETNVLPEMGFQIDFVTMSCNSPLHWHREMEILFIKRKRHTDHGRRELLYKTFGCDRGGLIDDP